MEEMEGGKRRGRQRERGIEERRPRRSFTSRKDWPLGWYRLQVGARVFQNLYFVTVVLWRCLFYRLSYHLLISEPKKALIQENHGLLGFTVTLDLKCLPTYVDMTVLQQ